ncbi:MAG: nitrogenase [Clostridiales Family XIII bacterium]|jgi:nitrogenase molybdenum-iron protein alpha chain|nr:nitrogenase [Clostridiales Family XIII bacterium]
MGTINIDAGTVPIRETRLGSITGYYGDLEDLSTKSSCGNLKNRERCFSQCSLCLNMCSIGEFTSLRDVAVINHAPAGCNAGSAATKVFAKQIAERIGKEYNSVLVGTDLNESDTVFGATESLPDIVRQVYENYRPSAIVIASSCVSGVIGEDIESVTSELDRQYDIPIFPIQCEGFRSKIWQSGADIADHAFVKYIVKPPQEKRNVINFKNFFESERQQITEIFAELGVTPQFLYLNSTIEEVEHLSESLATVSICGTLGTYLGNALEELYGVPYIRSLNPNGITGFESWLREIGKKIGKSAEVENYLTREKAKYIDKIEEVKDELKGLTAVIGMGPGYAFDVGRVLQELGLEIIWTTAWHLDYRYDNGEMPTSLRYMTEHSANNFGVSVADQQNFEIMHTLKTLKPDVYFSRHPGTTVWAVKQGIASVFVADEYTIFGYRGTLNFANMILDAVRNRSFEQNLAARTKLPYTDWWYEQNNQAMLLNEGETRLREAAAH